MNRKNVPGISAVLLCLAILGGCSINQLAVRTIGGVLSAGGESTVFTGDDDPDLVGDALPFALKLYEILAANDPGNAALSLSTGRTFVSYASAFVQTPASELPSSQFDRQVAMRMRAKKLFLRGREYILKGLELRRPGFRAALDAKSARAALGLVSRADIDYLFWVGVSWLGAFGADPFDFSLIVTVPRAMALLGQVAEWDDAYGGGSLHEIFISFYGSAPADLGGSEEKARQNFLRAVEISKGTRAGPYVALASTVSVKDQKLSEFRELLTAALAIDANREPSGRLENIINQRKARWLLDHADDFFLDTGEGQ